MMIDIESPLCEFAIFDPAKDAFANRSRLSAQTIVWEALNKRTIITIHVQLFSNLQAIYGDSIFLQQDREVVIEQLAKVLIVPISQNPLTPDLQQAYTDNHVWTEYLDNWADILRNKIKFIDVS